MEWGEWNAIRSNDMLKNGKEVGRNMKEWKRLWKRREYSYEGVEKNATAWKRVKRMQRNEKI